MAVPNSLIQKFSLCKQYGVQQVRQPLIFIIKITLMIKIHKTILPK